MLSVILTNPDIVTTEGTLDKISNLICMTGLAWIEKQQRLAPIAVIYIIRSASTLMIMLSFLYREAEEQGSGEVHINKVLLR